MTPIMEVQTKVDVPRNGDSILDPHNSKIMTMAPHMNTDISNKFFIFIFILIIL